MAARKGGGADLNLLVAVLAWEGGHVAGDDFLEAIARWQGDRRRNLVRAMIRKGLLTDDLHAALKTVAAREAETAGGARAALLKRPLPDEVRRILGAAAPETPPSEEPAPAPPPVTERERAEARALGHILRARAYIAARKRLAGEIGALRAQDEGTAIEGPGHPSWAERVEKQVRALEAERATALADGVSALRSALEAVSGHAEARRVLSELLAEAAAEAEQAGNSEAAANYRLEAAR